MGFMIDQAERLLRKNWVDAQELSEEIYSILTASGPIKIDSPVQIGTDSPEPSLSIVNNFGDRSGPTLNVTGGSILNGDTVIGGSVFTYQDVPDKYTILGGSSFGGSIFEGDNHITEVYLPEIPGWDPSLFDAINDFLRWVNSDINTGQVGDGPDPDPEETPTPTPTPTPSGGGTGLVGVVVSGSGDTYAVRIYPHGFAHAAATGTVTVKIPFIADEESLNPGDKIVPITAIQTGNGNEVVYYYQPPVWM